ncbi:hypothetical protein F66182_1898 [Fusarium sp. NRRL 66182]|nr:hypothetical protein F66182_1898 [Fusarium sp. NRRL 66182]
MAKPLPPTPRPLFVYGTLRALPLLAWALTGDASKTSAVAPLARPATVHGYARYAVKHGDYPAAVKHTDDSVIDGCLLLLETKTQRTKLDDFEGERYTATPVSVTLDQDGSVVDADMYVWNGDAEDVTRDPWDLDAFVKERLEDWLDLFEGMELVGEESDDTKQEK